MEPETKTLEIKRGNVTITSTQMSPVIYTATEQVTWKTGQAQINGIGTDRSAALFVLEESFSKLKDVLAAAQ